MKYYINKNIKIDMFNNNALIMVEKNGIVDMTKTIFVDGVGFDIIKILMNKKSVTFNYIYENICDQYEIDSNNVKSDILEFLTELEINGVLKSNE